jgi:molybdopterin-guanine dinucleotide biosynthesis protein A
LREFGTAVILCGGKSSRMGFDKCKIKIENKYLLEIIGEQLEEVFDDIILLSNDEFKFKEMKYKVMKDVIPDLGPMGLYIPP